MFGISIEVIDYQNDRKLVQVTSETHDEIISLHFVPNSYRPFASNQFGIGHASYNAQPEAYQKQKAQGFKAPELYKFPVPVDTRKFVEYWKGQNA